MLLIALIAVHSNDLILSSDLYFTIQHMGFQVDATKKCLEIHSSHI